MKPIRSALLALVTVLFSTAIQAGDSARIVLKGYDPVAYFTEGKPVKGDARYAYEWDEGRYHFATAKHRDLFASDPEKYAPQFGGYCTGSMARGVRNEGDPNAWVIRDGRLFVFGNTRVYESLGKEPDFLEKRLPNAAKHWKATKS